MAGHAFDDVPQNAEAEAEAFGVLGLLMLKDFR